MKIQYIKIKNLGPFKSTKIELSDKDVIGIQGRWKGNSRRSNQSGKSFLMEAIKWNLTGQSRADKDIELIHHGSDYGEVEVCIGDGSDTHVIRRGKDSKNNSVLEIGAKDKSKEAQETINKLIGFLPNEFDMTLFFKQEEINMFMDLKPQEKKKYIMQWLENHYWEDPYSRANKDYLSEQKHLDELKNNLVYLEDKLMGMSSTLEADLKERESDLEAAKVELGKLESQVKKLEKSLNTDSVSDLKESLSDLSKRRRFINSQMEKYRELCQEIDRLEEQVKSNKIEKPKFDESTIYKNIASTEASIREVSSKIKASKNLTGVCPVLNESCDRVKVNQSDIDNWVKVKSTLEKQLSSYQEGVTEIENYKKYFDRARRNKDKLDILVEQKNKFDLKENKDSLKEIDNEIKITEEKIQALNTRNTSTLISQYKNDIEDKKDSIEEIISDIARIKNNIELKRKLKQEVSELTVKIKDKASHVDDLKYVSFTFSKNGIPSQEIENAFTEIQDEINFVLSQFGTDMEVIFSADRELNEWEKSCVSCGYVFPKGYSKKDCTECGAAREKKRRDELQLKVTKGGQEYGFYMESGGGKTILSLAIRVALVRLKLRKTGSQFKVLFMDEVDAPFDEHNRDSFISLVNNVLIKKLGFLQVFWVSHSKIISEAIPHTLMVTKKSTYSEVDFV
jgi:DNA repair exonuclease SbcCD ATPase subunit